MCSNILHSCGLALIRLRKPLSYYVEKYGTPAWGLNTLCSLMEKQRSRGQDGAGIGVVKFDMPPGNRFLRRIRSACQNPLNTIFNTVCKDLTILDTMEPFDEILAKQQCKFLAEIYVGHLRYATHSQNGLECCQPYMYKNNIAAKNFMLAGNFNMTNTNELFKQIIRYGFNPESTSDTQIIMKLISYFLDQEHDQLAFNMGPGSLQKLRGFDLEKIISQEIDLIKIIKKAAQNWDGGYLFAGLIGNGDVFVCRDPAGIRPGFFYIDEEVIAVASERPALTNVFNIEPDQVQSIKPGHVLLIKKNGHIKLEPFIQEQPKKECSFERIYFSRDNDPDIYHERKMLGKKLAPRVLKALNNDIENAVFTYIPNSSKSCFEGLIEEVERLTRRNYADTLWLKIQQGSITQKDLYRLCNNKIRAQQLVHKNQKLRTFIAQDNFRHNLVAQLYDITKGIVKPTDTLVAIDDSIVRGTTLRRSIITKLAQLNPKKIIFVSSAPPIMYPDCYGIDMSKIGEFVAFKAAVSLLKDNQGENLLAEVAQKYSNYEKNNTEKPPPNFVKEMYDQCSPEELSAKIAEISRPKQLNWNGEIEIIYQTIESLHQAIPRYTGDWYFSGNYPTPGGFNVLQKSYLNWFSGRNQRAY